MHYELNATTRHSSVFDDEGFTVKGKKYLYSDVTGVRVVVNATVLGDATVKINLKSGVPVICSYDYNQKADGDAVVSFLQDLVAKHEQQTIAKWATGSVTAAELYKFCVDKGYGKVISGMGEEHFKLIVDSLMPGERILLPFVGEHNYNLTNKVYGDFAYAITNKRIIIAQKKFFSGQTITSVNLKNINNVTYKACLFSMGVITVDLIKGKFAVGVSKQDGQKIVNRIHEVLDEVKRSSASTSAPQKAQVVDPYEEVKKLKELLDLNIITQEEFDAKKKELLGL